MTALLLGIVAVAYFLRAYHLGYQSLWHDEAMSYYYAFLDWRVWVATSSPIEHPPLYFLLPRGWMGVAGESEFSMRYLSLIPSLLLVPLSYRLARALFPKSAAVAGAAWVRLAPFLARVHCRPDGAGAKATGRWRPSPGLPRS